MNRLRSAAYKLDPVLWLKEVVGQTPAAWQEEFLRAPRGAQILVLTARQMGKTTTAAWAIAHHMVHYANSLSVVVCPAQRQSAEAVRRVRATLVAAGAEPVTDNTYGLELKNGARVLALPGSDDSIRGLSVDGWIIADEAAHLSTNLIAAVRPMRARYPNSRVAMLSTAWTRTDPFWEAWESDDTHWLRLKVTADMPDCPLSAQHLEQERAALGEDDYKREYLGIPAGTHVSPFGWELYEQATTFFAPRVRPRLAVEIRAADGSVIVPHPENPMTWGGRFESLLIAHDVARSQDFATAVIGGLSPFDDSLMGIIEAKELQPKLYGHARANELAAIDAYYYHKALIVADISQDPTYAEVLYDTFGKRVIGVQIARSGDGLQHELRAVRNGVVPVFTIGRTQLFDFLHTQLLAQQVKLSKEADLRYAYSQLTKLELEFRQTGVVYNCPVGHHDDLAISMAMLVWAARHPKLPYFIRACQPRRPPPVSKFNWAAVT